jgi:hypothetical protein
MKTKINGSTWIIEVATSKQMKKERSDGEHLGGLCIPSEKRILIADDCVEYKVVAHELYHAYWSTLYLDDTNEIKLLDIEEIAAAMFADKGEEIVRKAKSVLKRLQKGK